MTNESLLKRVWGFEYSEEEHYGRLYVSYLRQKIEPDPAHPKYILTEKSLGYRFVDYGKSEVAGTPRAGVQGLRPWRVQGRARRGPGRSPENAP